MSVDAEKKAARQHGSNEQPDADQRTTLRTGPSVALQLQGAEWHFSNDGAGASLYPRDPWETDPRTYYTTLYNQFTSIIMISTFTGGVQAAVLSFMNDILSGAPLSVELFPTGQHNTGGSGRQSYSAYSLGLMLGLLAVSLNLTVAAVAAVNAALSCHFTINPPSTGRRPSMEERIIFCMIIQFIASGLAGVSLVLLCFKFDLAFSIVAAVMFFGGILISGYHILALFGARWFTVHLPSKKTATFLVAARCMRNLHGRCQLPVRFFLVHYLDVWNDAHLPNARGSP